jgi:hypothetical protein
LRHVAQRLSFGTGFDALNYAKDEQVFSARLLKLKQGQSQGPMIATTEDVALLQYAELLKQRLWTHSVQLFCEGDTHPGRLNAFASGVLVRFGGGTFIFSAAHVLAALKNKGLWVEASDGLVKLPTVPVSITGRPEMGNHEHDPLDAAVCLLPADIPQEWMMRAFDISTNAPIVSHEVPRYLLCGYPANRTAVDGPEQQTERKVLICSEVDDCVYVKKRYDKSTHLLLNWQGTWRTATHGHGARNLKGASGGAIWRFTPGTNATELVAIFTECTLPSGGGRVLVGTRIPIHLELAANLERVAASA